MPTEIRKNPLVKDKKTSLKELMGFVLTYYVMSFYFGEGSCEKIICNNIPTFDKNYTSHVKPLEGYFTQKAIGLSHIEFLKEMTDLLDNDNIERATEESYKMFNMIKNIISNFRGLEYIDKIKEEEYLKVSLIDWSVIYENNYWDYKTLCDSEEKDKTWDKMQLQKAIKSKIIKKNELMKYILKDNFNLLYSIALVYLAGIIFMSTMQNLDIVYESTEYVCFVVLKWLITISSSWNTYKIYKNNVSSKCLLVFGAIAVLFNPVFKVPFEQGAWYIIDWFVFVIYLVYFVMLYKKTKTNT